MGTVIEALGVLLTAKAFWSAGRAGLWVASIRGFGASMWGNSYNFVRAS